MVIQRDKPFVIWGQSPAGHIIDVKASWNSKTFSTIPDISGNWQVSLPASRANAAPQTIVITDNYNGTTKFTTLKNLLIGDVWIASGQSNMMFPVDSLEPWPGSTGVTNHKTEIASANFPAVRLTTVPYSRLTQPADHVSSNMRWQECTSATVRTYSAVAYFFGRKIHKETNVPVGLIVSAVAATYCQEWIDFNIIKPYPIYSGTKYASMLYNGMICPLRKLSIKGFIWDQGEANRYDPADYYTQLNSAMITNWRTAFKQADLPFYFVQMTPLAANYFQTNPWGDDPAANDYAFFREFQANVIKRTPLTGMAVSMDVDEIVSIHWKAKRPVAERLAALALRNEYKRNVQCVGPQFLKVVIQGNKGIIHFVAGTAEGLQTNNGKKLNQLFFMAGRDSVFKQAFAVIKGNTIEVTPPQGFKYPALALRYAFTNFAVTNLQNSAGFPAEPFRTDKWKDIQKTRL
ncbi:sialate O-acetylesterase [Mucilaginibacter hurinus]|nr:sialate O-acetylesterase [Mucilaginibacter hurinus]